MDQFCHRCGAVLGPGNHFQYESRSVCRDCLRHFNPFSAQLADEQTRFGNLAPIERRLMAQVLDAAVAYLLLLLGVLLGSLFPELEGPGAVLGFSALFGYFLFCDGLPNGQSLGKRLLHIHVVDGITGAPCTFGKSLVRNVTAILGVLDWMFIFGKSRRRLGDQLATTLVISGDGPARSNAADDEPPMEDFPAIDRVPPASPPMTAPMVPPILVLPSTPAPRTALTPFSAASQTLATAFETASSAATVEFTGSGPGSPAGPGEFLAPGEGGTPRGQDPPV